MADSERNRKGHSGKTRGAGGRAMRYVNNKHLQRFADLTEIDAAKAEIAGKATADERSDYIDHRDNKAKWSALREALWTLGCAKCWYSEATLQQGEGHVEHFRPKKRLSGAKHSGYWWRAFDWTNYRISHPTSNKRVTDYLTGKKAGKGGYFPLEDEATRAKSAAEEANENPVLLDPTNPRDCKLICFDTENGKPVPRFSKDEDKWRNQRAEDSIEYYHLNEGTWNFKRKDLMDDVGKLCDRIVDNAQGDRDAYEEMMDELLGYIESFAEFSSAALQVVREKGLLEHIAPVPEN